MRLYREMTQSALYLFLSPCTYSHLWKSPIPRLFLSISTPAVNSLLQTSAQYAGRWGNRHLLYTTTKKRILKQCNHNVWQNTVKILIASIKQGAFWQFMIHQWQGIQVMLSCIDTSGWCFHTTTSNVTHQKGDNTSVHQLLEWCINFQCAPMDGK